ncbi:hypothetical protein ACH41E_23635 [Streptomyces sp. NPDC020412]|uniref:hypothetical protein n=1 Tax=Streptomyces sp. NPDC020412 TaxID=3365073 RepID=UPI0037A42393
MAGKPRIPAAPYADTALDALGPGRLVSGSDRPVCRPPPTAPNEHLSTAERNEIFAQTVQRVYRLHTP